MDDKLIIKVKDNLKGEDGFKVFSVRIKDEIAAELDRIAADTHRSRNEIINIFIAYALTRCEIDGQD